MNILFVSTTRAGGSGLSQRQLATDDGSKATEEVAGNSVEYRNTLGFEGVGNSFAGGTFAGFRFTFNIDGV